MLTQPRRTLEEARSTSFDVSCAGEALWKVDATAAGLRAGGGVVSAALRGAPGESAAARWHRALRRVSLGRFVGRLLRDLGCEPERIEDARIAHGVRRAQLGTASTRRLFLFGLSVSGVPYGRGATDSPRAVADALAAFLRGGASADVMEDRFPFVKLGSAARAHERGELVEHRWAECLAWSARSAPRQELVALCFSTTTGRPYRAVDAIAIPVPDEPERYDVFSDAHCIGRGDADWAAAALDAALPDDVACAADAAPADLD